MPLRRLLLVLVTATALCHCRDHTYQDPGVRRQRHRQLRDEVDALRPRARTLQRSLAAARWRLLTRGETAASRRPGWISPGTLTRLRLLENSPLTGDARRRSLRLLRIFLTRQHLQQRPLLQRRIHTLHFQRPGARGGQAVGLDWQVFLAATGRKIPAAATQKDLLVRLDRALEEQHRLQRAAARKIGISLVHLEQEHLELDLAALLSWSRQAVRHTDPLWARVRPRLMPRPISVQELLGLVNGGVEQLHLPPDKQLSSLNLLRSSLGLPLETRGGKAVSKRAGIRPAAVALAPGDVRLVHGSWPGLTPQVELLEAAGYAACMGHGPKDWELSALGLRLGARTLGHLLGLVWLDPRWRTAHRALFGDSRPPGEEALAELARRRVLAGLLRLRLQAVAGLSARAALLGYRPAGSGKRARLADPGVMFWRAVAETRVPLTPGMGPDYLLLSPPSPLDLRAYVLAHMLHQRLRARHGPGWFQNSELGPWLLEKLCAPGSVGPRQLVRRLGFQKLDLAAPARNLERAWGELR